jgi:hypothetical protein
VLANAASSGDLVETISFYVSSVLNAIPAVNNAVTTAYINDGAVTQAKLATGVAGTGPAFSAYLNATQTITAGVFTKVQCGVEEFDTASAYDNATNYRFTPQVAGYYQVSGSVNLNSSVTNTECLVTIYKNGSVIKWGSYITRAATNQDIGSAASALVYLNGSTDYVELYGYGNGSGTLTFILGQARSFFQAVLVRAA